MTEQDERSETARKEKFDEWLRTSEPMKFYVYAKTFRCLSDNFVDARIGRYVWGLALEGRVYLVQRKTVHPMLTQFEYIAIKASNPPLAKIVARDYGLTHKWRRKEATTTLEEVA